MSVTPGTTVGRYAVHELLGSGGMGEVYKAHDPTLGRMVAIKVLRQTLGANAAAVTRFLQEARAASALNHPNILTIHEVGDHEASRFIVSEFVEGETLRQRIQRGPLTLREILDIVAQTASALAAAHAAGIVHRDIKPENLMLRPDGYVKVLDFGVAKLAERAPPSADDAATVAQGDTGHGMVVGTVAYMSPEQARGLHVDGRTDAFSLGVVLYELVTGRTPFAGPTPTDTLVAILDKELPPIRLHARGLPLPLEWAITKALDKDPNLRYQSIADLGVDLLRLKAAIESGRIAEISTASDAAGPMADQPIEVDLTEESEPVRAVSAVSRGTLVLAVAGAAALLAALVTYDRARLGADLPLQVPEGAVVTKARDAGASLGYPGLASRNASTFESALSVSDVAALAGLAEAREAVRSGVVARWSVGSSPTRDPNLLAGSTEPQEGEFAIHLDPKGQLVSFATGISPKPRTALDRERATQLGIETVRRVFGIGASGFELEYVQRAFPTGTIEMTWRNPARRFGHIEQVRVHLHGDRIVRVERTFEKPPGYTEPTLPAVASAIEAVQPWLGGLAFVAPCAFGLYVLFKTKRWDALRQRLPIVLCGLIIVSIADLLVNTLPSTQIVFGLILIVVVIIPTGLPALGGILLWIRRGAPARLWAADELTHGRVLTGAVSVSIVEGVMAGAAMAGVFVLTDLIGLRVPGFLPSISPAVSAVNNSVWMVLSGALLPASFMAIGIGLAFEALDRTRVPPVVSTVLVAVAFGMTAGARHQTILAILPPMAGLAVVVAIGVMVYRTRGLLALWIAVGVSALLPDAMAARALNDPGLVSLSNLLFGITGALAALGVWGLIAAHLKRKRTTSAAPA